MGIKLQSQPEGLCPMRMLTNGLYVSGVYQ